MGHAEKYFVVRSVLTDICFILLTSKMDHSHFTEYAAAQRRYSSQACSKLAKKKGKAILNSIFRIVKSVIQSITTVFINAVAMLHINAF